MNMMDNKIIKKGILALIIVLIICALATVYFKRQYIEEPIVAGPGVTRVVMLSDYFDGLKNTRVDTEVYFLEGKEPGGTLFIMGGNHPCEPSSLLSSIVFIENAIVEQGRLIVIPRAQKTAYDITEPGWGFPPRFHIKQDGDNMRWFRFGSRRMDAVVCWPLPTVFVNYPSGQVLAESEAQNLNRNFPGRPNGRKNEQLAYAILEMIKKENVNVSVDLHEAPPNRPLVNAIAVHEKALELASLANLNMEMFWNTMVRLELSPVNLRGLSHREWGDNSETFPGLIETCSPMHGPLRGKSTEKLVLDAKDEFELMAAKAGRSFTKYDEEGWPISVRNARHIQLIIELANAWTELNPEQPIIINNMPNYNEIVTNGIGQYLAIVKDPIPPLFPIPGIREFFFNEGRPLWGYGSNWVYDKVLGAREL